MRERRITHWQGESRSVFYVMTVNPMNDEEWEVEASFPTRELAERFLDDENQKEQLTSDSRRK
jgi:hypothetical protein